MSASTSGVFKAPVYNLTIYVKDMGDKISTIFSPLSDGSFLESQGDSIITFPLTDGALYVYRENILYWEIHKAEATHA